MQIRVSITREYMKAYPQHKHDVFEIMHYVKGEGVLRTDCGDFPFEEGTVIVVPPGIQHGSVSQGYFRNICINLPLSLRDQNGPLVLSKSSEVGGLADMIFRLVREDRHANQTAVNHLVKAAEDLIRRELHVVEDRFASAAEKVHDAALERFNDENFDMAAVIAATHYSDDYFRVKYRERYGTTPYAYIIDLRINCAADLLRQYGSQLTIAEIARQSGFGDPLYFSRLFKKKKGVSPREYAKGIRKK